MGRGQELLNLVKSIKQEKAMEACEKMLDSVESMEDYTNTTATVNDIKKDKVAYAAGKRIVGEMPPYNVEINTEADESESFNVLNNLQTIYTTDIDTSKYTSFSKAFQNLASLKELKGQLNTDNVTTLESAFDGCTNLNKISFSDTKKVTDWTKTFQNCNSLEEIENLDMSGATNITYAFNGCKKLKSIPKLTKSFNSYEGAFQDCEEMEEIPISQTTIPDNCSIKNAFAGMKKIKTAPIINMPRRDAVRYNAFSGCESLESATVVNTGGYAFTDVSTSAMFRDCKSLKEIPSGFNNFRLSGGSGYMFAGCTSLKTAPKISVSGTTDSIASMFEGCTNLESVELFTVNCNQTNSTYFQNIFKDCTNLKNITISGSSYGINGWFENCKSLTSIPEGLLVNGFPQSYGVRAFAGSGITELPEGLFKGMSLSGSNSRRPDWTGLFADCKQLQHIPVLPMNFNWSNGMAGMFSGCDALTDESLNNLMASFMPNTSAGYKNLRFYGISQEQAERCKTLSNYQAFLDAGWTTGY
jgi:uncharacterized ParB-like nuclease family protein